MTRETQNQKDSETQGQPNHLSGARSHCFFFFCVCLVCTGYWLTWTSCTLTSLWFHSFYFMLWRKENWRVWHSDQSNVTSPNDLNELSCVGPHPQTKTDALHSATEGLSTKAAIPLIVVMRWTCLSSSWNKFGHALNSSVITLDHPLSYSMFQ